MIASNMQTAVAQALRACGRTTLTGKPLAAFARRAFFVTPSYKARLAVRGYATATATKKATTTKAVKTTSAAKAAAKKPVARKKTATKAAGTKKATAAKKATTAKKAAKPKAKKKVVAKPVKKAKKAKKEVSPERKAALQKRELRSKALLYGEPKNLPSTAWLVYVTDRVRGSTTLNVNFADKIREISAQWNDLSDAEKQDYAQRAQDNKITNAANYKKWVETHTVAEIAAANNARSQLIRKFEYKTTSPKIHDERMPKRPTSAFGQYYRAKNSDLGLPATENMKALSAQWKSLSETEKKPYLDLATAEATKYHKEMEKVNA